MGPDFGRGFGEMIEFLMYGGLFLFSLVISLIILLILALTTTWTWLYLLIIPVVCATVCYSLYKLLRLG